MRRTIILDFIDKHITEKIYKKAREKEKELMPDNFTAYYLRSSVVYWFVIFLLFTISTFTFGFFDKVVLYILGSASIVSFIIILYHVSYRCSVDDTGMKVRKFWFFEKQVLWKDVKKVEVQEFEPYYAYYGKPLEKQAIIRNKQNKVIFTCSYDLVGFNLIVKKAKKERKKKH
ncbi:MAG: hypothetical protein IJO49_00930 [Clostridia bacterium]|nr:hypothetical protein [Clostridia bacterium]